MSIFHTYNDNTFRISYSQIRNVKEDVRNINWFNVSSRTYDSLNNIYYMTLPKTTKLFDGCSGEEYFTMEPMRFYQIPFDTTEKDWECNKKDLLKLCNETTSNYPHLHGLYFLHVCKGTGFCFSSFVICQGTVEKKLTTAVLRMKDSIPVCKEDIFLESLLIGKCSFIDIIELLQEGTPKKAIEKLRGIMPGRQSSADR